MRVLDRSGDSRRVGRSAETSDLLLRSRHPRRRIQRADVDGHSCGCAKISLALTIVLIVIAFIALLISGIGIMNIMLVTVKSEHAR